MKEQEIYSKAVQLWGKDSQVDMLVEECGELAEALVRLVVYNQYPSNPDLVITEIVDVQILLNQMRLIYGRALEELILSGLRDVRELPELLDTMPQQERGDITIPLRMVHVLLKNRRGKASDEDVIRMAIETQTFVNDLRAQMSSQGDLIEMASLGETAEECWRRVKAQKLSYVQSLIEKSEQGKAAS